MTAMADVAVPIRTAGKHWTRAEELPIFFGELARARMLADRTMRWKVKLGATTREFDMPITAQVPDERVSWAWTEKSQHPGEAGVPCDVDGELTRIIRKG